MKNFENENSPDPAIHCEHLQQEMADLIEHLHRDIKRVTEPQFQALLETGAEVIGGLKTAFQHYSEHRELAWQPSAAR